MIKSQIKYIYEVFVNSDSGNNRMVFVNGLKHINYPDRININKYEFCLPSNTRILFNISKFKFINIEGNYILL